MDDFFATKSAAPALGCEASTGKPAFTVAAPARSGPSWPRTGTVASAIKLQLGSP
jgi:hypothetical protein